MENKKTRYRSTFYFEGKRYEAASSSSQKEADQKAAIMQERLKRGEVGISRNMTVTRWADEWLETYKKPKLLDKTYRDYKSRIDNIIVPAIGSMRLRDVKDVHLQKILNNKAGYSLDRMKKLHQAIRGIFGRATVSGLIAKDPSASLTLPAAVDGTRRSLTDFEREHFLKVSETHYAGLMFQVMLHCGLRTGEVVALDWRDVDWEKQRIIVSRAMESGSDNIKPPKTAAGVRVVPVPNNLFAKLKSCAGDPFSPMFTHPNSKARYTSMARYRAWESLKDAIDISMGAQFDTVKGANGRKRTTKVLSVVSPDFVPYCLRHTYCTDLQDKGVPINMAKYLMGHSNISVTAKIYTHISEISIDNAAALINGGSSEKVEITVESL